MFIFLIGISILVEISNAYVLLQVRKQNDNLSNIDALIHKVVPSDKLGMFAQKLARKQLNVKTDVKTIEKTKKDRTVRQIIDYSDNEEKGGKVGKEELSLSMDENSEPNLVKLIDLAIQHFTTNGAPVLRANGQDKPKTIKFRTGESSILYEINSQSFISALEELLSSKTVRGYLDNLTKKAAFVYRAIKDSKQ